MPNGSSLFLGAIGVGRRVSIGARSSLSPPQNLCSRFLVRTLDLEQLTPLSPSYKFSLGIHLSFRFLPRFLFELPAQPSLPHEISSRPLTPLNPIFESVSLLGLSLFPSSLEVCPVICLDSSLECSLLSIRELGEPLLYCSPFLEAS